MTNQDWPVEQQLRGALASLRPASAAPATLRSRVASVPGEHPSAPFAVRLVRRLAGPGPVAVLVTAAAVAAAAFTLGKLGLPPDGTTGGGNATAPRFDPTVEGPGLIRFPVPVLQIAWGFAVLTAVVLAIRWRTRIGVEYWGDMGRGLLVALLLIGPTALAIQPPIRESDGSSGTALGFGPSADPPPGGIGPTVRYVNAVSGGPFIVFFDVTNNSMLPMTLNGMVSNDEPATAGPRWIALALPSVANTYPNGVQDLRPFTPQVIGPNDRITLYLVGKAGCSFGPSFDLAAPGTTAYASFSRDVQLGYSVLGLASTTTFTMPMQVVEPDGPPCS